MIIGMTKEAKKIMTHYKAGKTTQEIAEQVGATEASVDFLLEQLKVFAFID